MIRDTVLLDMDGTITPPRKSINGQTVLAILELCLVADVAIVSGSGIDYLIEQCGSYFIHSGCAAEITLMPCNGTQVYKFKDGEYQQTYSILIVDALGRNLYRKIISGILLSQAEIIKNFDFEIFGNFISYRSSILNWSLIGRDSTLENREKFASHPHNKQIRLSAIETFKKLSKLNYDELNELEMVLGGQTSIDIYPAGWDKTFALRHLKHHRVWFIGDKCQPGENDYQLFKKLKTTAFISSGPEETEILIRQIISRIKGYAN